MRRRRVNIASGAVHLCMMLFVQKIPDVFCHASDSDGLSLATRRLLL